MQLPFIYLYCCCYCYSDIMVNEICKISDNDKSACELPPPLDGNFFKITSEKGDKVVAKCINCVNKSISLFPAFSNHVVSQSEVNRLVVNYIIEGMCPLATVEKDSFVALIKGLAPSATVMTRKTLSEHVNLKYDFMLNTLRGCLAKVEYVCTTADIWNTNNRSYMGMTAHWITSDLVRKSAALACRRFTGSHTFDRVAEIINDCLGQFELDTKKAITTVTDNASYFRKAFVEYHIDRDIEEDEVEEGDISYHDIDDILNRGFDTNNDATMLIQLPRHERCVCHTLHLIATTDVEKAELGTAYARMSQASFGRCQSLWNSVRRSSKASDAVVAICDGEHLKIPCPTRWNSKFQAIGKLLKLSDKLGPICEAVNLTKFARAEIEFLKEYYRTMEPLACTLDQLQGDKDCFLGMLMPKLIQLWLKMNRLLNDNLYYCRPLVLALLNAIASRFQRYLDFDLSDEGIREAVLASVSVEMGSSRVA